jgi:hypothetical protein
MTMATLGTNTNGTSLPNEGVIIIQSNTHDTPEDDSVAHLSDGAASSAEDGATRNLAKEERMVVYARWLVFWVMTAAAILVGVETYKVSSDREQKAFLDEVSLFCSHERGYTIDRCLYMPLCELKIF